MLWDRIADILFHALMILLVILIGTLAVIENCGAEEKPVLPPMPWAGVDSYCEPHKVGEKTINSLPVDTLPQEGKDIVECDTDYFIYNMQLSFYYWDKSIKQGNELQLQRDLNLVHNKNTVLTKETTVWKWVAIGVAILAVGSSSYLVGKYAK